MSVIIDALLSPNSVSIHKLSNSSKKGLAQNSVLDTISAKRAWKKAENPRPLQMREIRNDLAQKRHEASLEALKASPLTGEIIGEVLNAFDTYATNLLREKNPNILRSKQFHYTKQLAEVCREIKEILETPNFHITDADMQKLHEKLSSALKFFYDHQDELKGCKINNSFSDPFVNFLQHLNFQIRTQAEGMEVTERIGRDALEWKNENNSDIRTNTNFATKLADDVEEVFNNMPGDHWDKGLNWFMWALKNIAEAFLAFLDNRISGCHDLYNSYERGNPDMKIGNIFIKDAHNNTHNICLHMGPGPMNDPALTQAQIDWEKKMGIAHQMTTFEFNEKKGETTRVSKMGALAKDHAEKKVGDAPLLTLIGMPYDGKIAKCKENFVHIRSVDHFHSELRKELLTNLESKRTIPEDIRDYDGFALPKLSDQDIRKTIEASRQAFQCTLGTVDFNVDAKQTRRLNATMLAGFNAFLSIKMMMKLSDSLEGLPADRKEQIISATLERACKQCADRGPLANALFIAFMKMIEKGSLDEQDEKQLIGLLVGRAMLAGPDRKMVKGRRDPFINLFRMIGNSPDEFVTILRNFAGVRNGEKSPIRFVPSNAPNDLPDQTLSTSSFPFQSNFTCVPLEE